MLTWTEDRDATGPAYPGVRKAKGQRGDYRIACVSMGKDSERGPYAYSLAVRSQPGNPESAQLLRVIACVPAEVAERQKAYGKLRELAETFDDGKPITD